MSGLISSDPLATLAMEAGMVRAPLAEGAAQGDTQLDSKQRAAVIGEPVPIVFCRRDESAGTGGVLVSPAATEARFSNDASNAVTASYHLVLSEGRIGSIQVRDVFQRSCRVGSHSQTYDRRAGTWTPGNFVTAQAGYDMPECPYYCGTVGTYSGMSTLSFQVTIPDGFDQWNRQVHCFIRNGMEVTRLLDNVTGSSNNFADLYHWSLINCAKLSSGQIDYASLASAARFLHVNGFNCDINITESQNLGEMVAKMAPYFLLTETRVAGRRGLRPVLPVNSDGTIKTTAVEWAYTFTEDHILPDQLQISYVPSADRKPFAVRSIWRQQLDDDHGIIRSSEVRLAGEAEEGPYEQHDLSQFCTRENHAVKIAAYIRARRKYTTHTASVSCRSIDFPATLQAGDIVRMKLYRSSDIAASGLWDYLYQVERITKTAAGDVSMSLVHFPINGSGISPIALAVAQTLGTGIMLTSNRTGVSCDASPSRSTDTTVPAETYMFGSGIAPTYIFTGEDYESYEDVPENIADEISPGKTINEKPKPPNKEPKEQQPEPAPESEPEGDNSNGFTGWYQVSNWVDHTVEASYLYGLTEYYYWDMSSDVVSGGPGNGTFEGVKQISGPLLSLDYLLAAWGTIVQAGGTFTWNWSLTKTHQDDIAVFEVYSQPKDWADPSANQTAAIYMTATTGNVSINLQQGSYIYFIVGSAEPTTHPGTTLYITNFDWPV